MSTTTDPRPRRPGRRRAARARRAAPLRVPGRHRPDPRQRPVARGRRPARPAARLGVADPHAAARSRSRPSSGGATVLAARALTEGTERHDAIALVEAAERLGASLHAEAGWDALTVGVDVPASRLEPALELVAEVLLEPTFPESEVERLRDERLNDLLQAQADPRRRVEEAFVGTIYAAERAVPPAVRRDARHRRAADAPRPPRDLPARRSDPARATLVVGGDLAGLDVDGIAERLLRVVGRSARGSRVERRRRDRRHRDVRRRGSSGSIHRPGSVQTEIRVGHRGLPRRIADFHAVSVMSAILGGLFNSRLNMKLREEKGYTYGAGAGFDMRRGAGPFAARAAVNTEVTVPAIVDMLAELTRMRDVPVDESELAAARDFLIGVFPLRFETAGAVVGALGGLAVHGLRRRGAGRLPGQRSRPSTSTAVAAAARAHLHVDDAAIVLVGDVDAFGPALEAAGLGRIVIERDEVAVATGAGRGGRPARTDRRRGRHRPDGRRRGTRAAGSRRHRRGRRRGDTGRPDGGHRPGLKPFRAAVSGE